MGKNRRKKGNHRRDDLVAYNGKPVSKSMLQKRLRLYVLYTILGVFLFYIIGEFGVIKTGIDRMYIYLQYSVLVMFASVLGPMSGLIIGFVGHSLIDLLRGDGYWISWVLGSTFLGWFVGLMSKHYAGTNFREGRIGFNRKTNPHFKKNVFSLIVVLGNVVAWLLIAPILNMCVMHDSFKTAYGNAIFVFASNTITTTIICDIFVSAYKNLVIRRIVAIVVVINTLISLSYQEVGAGNLLLYAFTLVACILVFVYDPNDKNRSKKIMVGIVSFLMTAYVVFLIFIAAAGYRNHAVGDEKVVVVLGAGLKGDQPSRTLKARLDKAIEYYNEHPDVLIITSGGQGSDEIIAEGMAMRNYLMANGIPEDVIFAETKSTTTQENFRYSLDIMYTLGLNEDTPIVYITNDFHSYRAGGYAKMEGLTNVHSYASATPKITLIPNYLREGLATILYYIKLAKA